GGGGGGGGRGGGGGYGGRRRPGRSGLPDARLDCGQRRGVRRPDSQRSVDERGPGALDRVRQSPQGRSAERRADRGAGTRFGDSLGSTDGRGKRWLRSEGCSRRW